MTGIEIRPTIVEESGSPVDTIIPFGWYQMCWSYELAVGEVKPFRYFGIDLVAYRGASGEVHVLDAYCPHLGAHLGYGATVSRERLVCPFHGWEWSPSGHNVAVPYASPVSKKRVRPWRVEEVDGIVLIWYHPEGVEPKFRIPPFWVDRDCPYLPINAQSTKFWPGVTFPPQYASENLVDYAHFKFVHRAHDVAAVDSVEADGYVFRTVLKLEMGAGRETTWMTPRGPAPARLFTEVFGPQTSVVRFKIADHAIHDSVVAMGVTPIEATPERSNLWITVYVPETDPMGLDRDPGTLAKHWYAQEFAQVDQDVVIWSHMRYIPKAPLRAEESRPFRTMRMWARQFYLLPAEPAARTTDERVN
ncbi:MAG TPA: aromatic ring-hydroxylating dioxygenase subunit alpha [Pseudonocardia sp.]|jgi:phenylpropionate dioxygenase-like ring-hydroxylating dioxygenase large terminal subunit